MSIEENKCDITEGFYSVIRKCEKCGKSYARHVGNSRFCKNCIPEIEKRELFNAKVIGFAMATMAMILISISYANASSFEWVRPIGGGVTNINNTNNTFITYNITNITINNITIINATDLYINDSGDIARGYSAFNWNRSNMSNISVETVAVLMTMRNDTRNNMSYLSRSIYPRSNACYSVGYYSFVAAAPSTEINHIYSAGWFDDLYSVRGRTYNYNYSCTQNDTLFKSSRLIPEMIQATRRNSDNGYVYETKKITEFYDIVPEQVELQLLESDRFIKYQIGFTVVFTRPYQPNVNEYPSVQATCGFVGKTNPSWWLYGGSVTAWFDQLNETGFSGHCQLWNPLVMGVYVTPNASVYFSWSARDDEDEQAGRVYGASPIVDELTLTGDGW